MVLEKEGAQYVLSNTLFKNSVTKFTPGVEFDYTSLNGRPVKTTISINGNTLHEVQKDADGTKNCIDRTFKPNEVQVVIQQLILFQAIVLVKILWYRY